MRTMEADVRMRRETYLMAPSFFAAGVAATLRWCRQNRPDVIHAHWLLPNGFFGAVASRQLGIPLVVSIPGSDALVAGQNPLFRAMTRFTLYQAGLITANSHTLRDVAVQELGADPAKFDLIIYGVDPNALRPDPTGTSEFRAGLGIPDDALLLLAVGRMVYKKGFDIALRALARSQTKWSSITLHPPPSTLHSPLHPPRPRRRRRSPGRVAGPWRATSGWTATCTGSAGCPLIAWGKSTTRPTRWSCPQSLAPPMDSTSACWMRWPAPGR